MNTTALIVLVVGYVVGVVWFYGTEYAFYQFFSSEDKGRFRAFLFALGWPYVAIVDPEYATDNWSVYFGFRL